MTKINCTCLIPFYNEGERLVHVLTEISKIPNIKVLVVDDGSTDGQAESIQAQFPMAKFIGYSQNQGKTQAVKYGLQFVDTPLVLLFDADMHHFSWQKLADGIRYMTENPEADCLIYRQIDDPLIPRLLHFDVIFSGQRIMKTADLKSILHQAVSGYQLEFMVNNFLLNHHKTIVALDFHSRNHLKMQKWPFWVAMKKTCDFQKRFFSRDFIWFWFKFRPQKITA